MENSLIKALARFLVRLSRFPSIQGILQKLALTYRQEQILTRSAPEHQVPEVMAIEARQASAIRGVRLNLLVPAVSQKHVFGGIETALQLFDRLRHHFDHVRIVVTDESEPAPRPEAYYGTWPIVNMADESPATNHIVAAGSRWAQTLAVAPEDYFMATAWWTAHNALALMDWQEHQWPGEGHRRMIYLIQDFEPGFYPWSTRYLLAEATYSHPNRTIAIINSQYLSDFMTAQGHSFHFREIVHPRLHPALAAFRARHAIFSKERILLVYGRPGTERNAFSLIVATLKLWAMKTPRPTDWRILAAGEDFTPIDLGFGCQLLSLGKLTLESYADLLSRTAVGLSLMVSPHPSYPPLEMAAFGARVVTNRFANKNLSSVTPALVSPETSDPKGLASALLSLTMEFESRQDSERRVRLTDIVWHGPFLQTSEGTDHWVAAIASQVTAGTPASRPLTEEMCAP